MNFPCQTQLHLASVEGMGIPKPLEKFISDTQTIETIPYRPCGDSQDVIKRSLLPYLPIKGIEVPHREMFEEAKKLIPAMVPHRADRESHHGWKSLVLHGISSAHTQGAERYGMDPEDRSIYHWTDISRLCPVTTDFFKTAFKYEWYHRVRFMLLEPGGYVMPHTDFDHYVLGPVNIALNNPPECGFYMRGAGRLPFRAGTVMKLALVNEHAVYNASSEPRIHMIVHGAPDWRHWNEIFWQSFQTTVATSDHPRFLAEPG